MREVSEGYAKLVVALNMFGDAALDSQRVSLLYKEIQVSHDLACVTQKPAGRAQLQTLGVDYCLKMRHCVQQCVCLRFSGSCLAHTGADWLL